MTLTQEIRKTKSSGDSGVTYPYGFRIWDESELYVVISNKVTPFEKETGTVGVHFTVSGVGAENGGEITMIGTWAASPPDSTKYVTCMGELEYKQETGLSNQGVPEGNVLERMVDKVVRLCQQLKEEVDRCLKVDETSDEDPEDLIYESFTQTAPVDDSGFGGVLSGATATVQGCLDQIDSDAAPLASPVLTGTPTAPTAAMGTKTTQVATTAFVTRSAYVLLAEDTVSDETELDLFAGGDLMSTYNMLRLEFILEPEAALADLVMRILDSGGSPRTSAQYDWAAYGRDSDGSAIAEDAESQTAWTLIPSQVISAAPAMGSFELYVEDSIGQPMGIGQIVWSVPTRMYTASYGVHYSSAVLNFGGVRLYYSTDNISGTARLWGLPKGS